MKKKRLFCLIVLWSSFVSAAQLHCAFGMMGTTIFQSKSELTTDRQIGTYSWAAFQGTPEKQIPNLVLPPVPGAENYRFQLDEGFADQNIMISVSTQKDAHGALKAVAVNPQATIGGKMAGLCTFAE